MRIKYVVDSLKYKKFHIFAFEKPSVIIQKEIQFIVFKLFFYHFDNLTIISIQMKIF